MSAPNLTTDQNLLPVQAYFDVNGNFQTFIGQGQPFYATLNPAQSGLNITNSTINSTTIGLVTPSSGVFTNISTTTGTISTTPANPTDLVNKNYVDMFVQGYAIKAECQVASTGNLTLSGLQTIDGYTTLVGDRVLVKNQTTQAQNGIYVAASGAWARSSDANTWNSLISAFTFIQNGSTQANSGWVCTISTGGTLGTTPVTWSQLASAASYFAGTGLTLSSYTFSITPVGTAGTYGSASSVPVFVTNASGQVTSVTNTSISIAPSQINATIPNSGLTNSSITVNGSAISLGGSATITAVNPNALTIGTGLSGSSYNGSSAVTIALANTAVTAASYTLASVTFNAQGQATAASSASTTGSGNVVLATSPTLVTPNLGTPSTLVGTNITGTASGLSIGGNAATATTATNLSGTTQYSVPYQSGSATTSFLSPGTSGSLLMTLGAVSAPIWVATSSLTTGSATNIAGGAAGSVPYQTGSGATTFLALGTSGYVLTAGASAPQYTAQSSLSVGTATNLAGGAASNIVYQSASGTTAFLANGTSGQFLQSNGSSAPTWATPVSYASVTDDTTTNATRYPLFANQTSGNLATEYTSSTKLQYNPSTGVLTSTGFSGSGASLTSIPNGALVNSSITVGTTAIALGASSTNLAGLTSVTSTTFVGALSGNATSATTATTATGALNVQVTDSTTSSSTFYPTMSPGTAASTNYALGTSSSKLSFVPNTGVLSATSFSGAGTGLTGTASSLSIGGNAATATSATTATNLAGGANGSVPYQTASGTTTFLAAGTNGYVLTLAGGVPTWAASTGGVTSITGTTNQITASASTGAVTLSLPTSVTTGQYIANQTITGALSQGAFAYGTLGYSDVNILGSFASSVNTYNQLIIQNTNNGATASANLNVSNNSATSTTNFGEFGINSSGFVGSGFSTAGWTYLASASTDLAIGTYGSNAIHFIVNTGSSDALTISTAGNVTTPNVLTGAEVSASNGIFINNKTVGASYSIPSGYAASSVGPVTLSNGVTVTVPSGSKWVVL